LEKIELLDANDIHDLAVNRVRKLSWFWRYWDVTPTFFIPLFGLGLYLRQINQVAGTFIAIGGIVGYAAIFLLFYRKYKYHVEKIKGQLEITEKFIVGDKNVEKGNSDFTA
jgi:hypothetical protein